MCKEKDDFKKTLKHLQQVCSDGQLYYNIWKNLFYDLADNRNIYSDIQIFLYSTLDAHFEASVSRLYRLLDTHSDSISIKYFLNFIESNPFILKYVDKEKLKNELKNDKELLSNNEKINILRTLRDKYYVHFDKKYRVDYDELFKENQITPNEIESLFDLLEKTLTKYENYFINYPERVDNYCGEDDVILAMQILKEYHIKQKKK